MPGTVTTPRQLIDWGARLFEEGGLVFQHGTDNALDESAALVMHVLGISYDQPDSVLDAGVIPADRERVRALLQQRVSTRKPAAYLINTAWFAELPFYVDERVLVPRSPVAELIGAQFSPWIDPGTVDSLLDLCTGSGCIGIACAYAFPHARVTCSDLSTDALAVARENVRRHGLEERVSLCESDLFAALGAQRYDIIVSNPPYVPLHEFAELADEFRHEPALGLAAGADGLDVVVKILQHAARHLHAKGILVVEVGHTRELLIDRYPGIPFTWLEFENGGGGVFLLDYNQLVEHQHEFNAVASTRDEVR
jgi:ribosomal protein L3 glutamine methyltransferase